jgi:hypothetical protein
MEVFRGLQNSAFTEWFLGSESIWTYPTVLTLHTIGLAMLVGASLMIHLRVLQVGTAVPLAGLRPLYRVIWAGFIINLASGTMLFITEAADRVMDPIFYAKLASIGLALWLGLRIKRRVIDPDVVAPQQVAKSRGLAAASIALWTVAIVTGRLMAYFAN